MLDWLAARGVDRANLKRMSGYSNQVFLVEHENAALSVLRAPDRGVPSGLCPLAHDTARVFKIHQDVAELGLAPKVIEADLQTGIMWLEYAGEPHPLAKDNFVQWRGMISRLQQSGLDWREAGAQEHDGAGLKYLRQLSDSAPTSNGQVYADELLSLGLSRGYADYPLVPVHGDLNPGNCLYYNACDRWFAIDWDFAGMRVAEWEYAALIVEHGWNIEWAEAFANKINRADLSWFCAMFALWSWEWHVQRESAAEVIAQKWRIVEYWFECVNLGCINVIKPQERLY
uniref:Thiamine kinase n=1 Tax=uncultured Thiotrichaceae bacterium TaxID=298394 RepID=A0A6S6TTI5_9GAMM|nr:MAG: Thiamine kinase [uncultured Thiotrichaceae bacterium]